MCINTVGKTTSLEIHENYFILSSLPPDTEYAFQVSLNFVIWQQVNKHI